MPIEKAFAIEAEPADIWQALWSDLAAGEPDSYIIEHSNWPHALTIQIDLAGMPSRIAYTITPAADHSEVSVTLDPLSVRYPLLQILTFGRMRTSIELALVQGLANLKESLEDPPGDEEPAEWIPGF